MYCYAVWKRELASDDEDMMSLVRNAARLIRFMCSVGSKDRISADELKMGSD